MLPKREIVSPLTRILLYFNLILNYSPLPFTDSGNHQQLFDSPETALLLTKVHDSACEDGTDAWQCFELHQRRGVQVQYKKEGDHALHDFVSP